MFPNREPVPVTYRIPDPDVHSIPGILCADADGV